MTEQQIAQELIKGVKILKVFRDTLYAHDMNGEAIDPFVLEAADEVIGNLEDEAPGMLDEEDN